MLKQYLIAMSFTRGNTPLEYYFTVKNCDMRTRESKNKNKYLWNESAERLFKFVNICDIKIKIGASGEIRLIMPNGDTARYFLKVIKGNGWNGVD